MKCITFSQLENILRTAVKLCDEPLSKIAIAVGFTPAGFSTWTTKRSHLSIEKGDNLVKYFNENYPEVLKLAIMYEKSTKKE